jgi:hypothetical protein
MRCFVFKVNNEVSGNPVDIQGGASAAVYEMTSLDMLKDERSVKMHWMSWKLYSQCIESQPRAFKNANRAVPLTCLKPPYSGLITVYSGNSFVTYW